MDTVRDPVSLSGEDARHPVSPTDLTHLESAPREIGTPQVEQWMAAARPQLLRLARAHGFAAEVAGDVVQETLLEAWRHLDALSAPDGFNHWLSAICHNVCKRYARSLRRLAQREVPFDPSARVDADSTSQTLPPPDLCDPLGMDPAEELERQDWETLVDHALGHLPASVREAVELCYLAEVPQRESAVRLGLTIRALEARLYRARQQLRQVLSGPLRSEAEVLGLPVGEGRPEGWRETRLWCLACGRQRLHGAFESLPDGQINLHLHCPVCHHEVNSWGHVPLHDLRSFRPAYKRVMQAASTYFLPGLEVGWLPCLLCGAQQRPRITSLEALDKPIDEQDRDASGVWVVLQCAACHQHDAEMRVGTILWAHPAVQHFLGGHPRAMMEPETRVEYLGLPVIRIPLRDLCSAARLTLLAHPQTLQVQATIEE
jgi:RNA polymerase sigma-70 factor (ECF subfamily)